jgi:hypothetical protein
VDAHVSDIQAIFGEEAERHRDSKAPPAQAEKAARIETTRKRFLARLLRLEMR